MIPEYSDMLEPMLCLIYLMGGEKHSVHAGELYKPLADYLGLSEAERFAARSQERNEPQWYNRVQWVRQRLINEGLVVGIRRGVWGLTEEGLELARTAVSRYPKLLP